MIRSTLLHSIGRPIAFHPGLVPILGSVNAVLFFGQIFYWQDKASSDFGVYKTAEEIQQETGLTYREQANAREKLRACGVLIETEKRLEHRIYFRIDFDVLDELLANCGERISRNDKSAIRETTKAQSVELTKAQSVIQRLPEITFTSTTACGLAIAATGQALSADSATCSQSVEKEQNTKADKGGSISKYAEYFQPSTRDLVTMDMSWRPSKHFSDAIKMAGKSPDELTNELLAKFILQKTGEKATQGAFDKQLLRWVIGELKAPRNGANEAAGPSTKGSRRIKNRFNNINDRNHGETGDL